MRLSHKETGSNGHCSGPPFDSPSARFRRAIFMSKDQTFTSDSDFPQVAEGRCGCAGAQDAPPATPNRAWSKRGVTEAEVRAMLERATGLAELHLNDVP